MKITVGRMQMLILEELWARHEATAREITEGVSKSTPTTHSTVQTLLRKLMAKGAVAHEKRGRTFLFRALAAREEVRKSAAQDILDRVFKGSITGLVAHILAEEEITPEDLAEIKAMIERKEQEAKL